MLQHIESPDRIERFVCEGNDFSIIDETGGRMFPRNVDTGLRDVDSAGLKTSQSQVPHNLPNSATDIENSCLGFHLERESLCIFMIKGL